MKRWRIYFHKVDQFSRPWWCVDNGDISSQIRVGHVRLGEVPGFTGVRSYSVGVPDDQGGIKGTTPPPTEPKVWLEVEAEATFQAGGVVFHPFEKPE
jgi:hypothetical protein